MVVFDPHEDGTVRAQLWLVTFADLTALLVALFVLIYSMSVPMSVSSHGSGVVRNGVAADVGKTASRLGVDGAPRSGLAGDLTLGYLAAVLTNRQLSNGEGVGVVTHRIEGDRLVVRFDSVFLFDNSRDAGAVLSVRGADRISKLTQILGSVGNPVSLIVPVWQDDWVQAFDQADMVADGFRRAGYERAVERFVAPGVELQDIQSVMLVIGRQEGGRRT